MTQTYKGTTITYNEEENSWEFTLRGKERHSGSLKLAKEAIDAKPPEGKKAFERFKAYVVNWDDIKPATVTSIAETGRYQSPCVWVQYDKSVEAYRQREKVSVGSVYPITDFNTAIVAQVKELQLQAEELSKKTKATKDRMRAWKFDPKQYE